MQNIVHMNIITSTVMDYLFVEKTSKWMNESTANGCTRQLEDAIFQRLLLLQCNNGLVTFAAFNGVENEDAMHLWRQ